ncbi:MAG: NAD-dependent epimerase/dehydratase family protein [Magnetococcus sp. WYHC-3]
MSGNHAMTPLSAASRVLVTGASGFIGAAVARKLASRGYQLRLLLRDPARRPAGVPGECVAGDLRYPDSLHGIEDGVDAVVHAAGLLGRWGVAGAALWQVNAEAPVSLLARFRSRGVLRFVHLSTCGVSGPLSRVPGDESTPCHPVTAYETAKLQGEESLLRCARLWQMPVVVVRPTWTYGPGDTQKWPLFRRVALGKFAYIGSGNNYLHPLYIDDAVAGICAALEQGGNGEVYVWGGSAPVTVRDLVGALALALGQPAPTRQVPLWLARGVAPLLEGVAHVTAREPLLTRSRLLMFSADYAYDCRKAQQAWGLVPGVALATGLQRTVADYRRRGWL